MIWCPACGAQGDDGDLYCRACGNRLPAIGAAPPFEDGLAPSSLPDAPGLPGKVVFVRVSHGLAAAAGYYDVHEVADGQVVKSRKIKPARGGDSFPEGWFDEQVAGLDDETETELEALLQDLRFCDIDKETDGTTLVSPRDRGLSMRVGYVEPGGDPA